MKIKTLLATNNIESIKCILNIINEIKSLEISYIATNKEETIKLLQEEEFDLIILDLKIINLDNIEKIKNISNIIVISDDSSLINEISKNPIIIDVINKMDYKTLHYKFRKIVDNKFLSLNPNGIEQYVISELSLLGYDFKYKGTQFLLEVILYIYKNKNLELLQNLKENVYKYIANINNTSITNVKTCIIRATNYMYIYQNKTTNKYFSFNYKPTPKTIITTIIMKLNCFSLENLNLN